MVYVPKEGKVTHHLSVNLQKKVGVYYDTHLLGAENGTRTHDLLITNELLYQLSYFGKPAS